jgi:hypothetical protein
MRSCPMGGTATPPCSGKSCERLVGERERPAGGPSRLIFHDIDRLLPASSELLQQGGRINLTLRRVAKP